MCKKKIAVFSTAWNAGYLYDLLQGMKQGAAQRGLDLFLFNTYGDSDQEYEVFTQGEYSIFSLPDLTLFDGVLLASNSVGNRQWMNSLMERIRDAGIPCVGVEQPVEGTCYIGVDNYTAMYSIVEHLVRDKHCRVLNYVGGPADNEENRSRKQAFCDALRTYGITPEPERIRHYSFRWEDGVQAYRDFKAAGLDDADAIVCANDYMAIGYLQGAGEDGKNAPEDFLITGFDNIKEAQQYAPRITSVDRAREELGRSSIYYLDDLIDKRPCPAKVFVPFRPVFAQSSDDETDHGSDEQFRREVFATNTSNRVMRLHLKHLRTALLGNRSVADFMDIMCYYAPFLGIEHFAMGLESGKILENSMGDRLFFGVVNGKSIRDYSAASGLIPREFLTEDGRSHTYLFSPCHCSGKNFGYCVIIDNFEVVRENLLSEWMLAVDNAVENLRQSLHLQIMNRKLNNLYRRDPLTGLYNRFALEEMGGELLRKNRGLGKSTLIIFVDMNCLKKANDIYGHDMGDAALKTMADAIRQVCVDRMEFAVRYGGDEFLMLGDDPGMEQTAAIMEQVERTITEQGRQRKLPFELTASTGCSQVPPGAGENLEHYIRLADQHMYDRKMSSKGK